jgi:hypothetical protein
VSGFPIRATRLGEFSPIGRFVTLGSILKFTEVSQILGLLFAAVKVMKLILTKKGWATLHMCDVFTNSFGHPVSKI